MIIKKTTHIMGNTEMGKTFFANQEANNLLANNEKVIYVSVFDDLNNSNLEKVFIKEEADIVQIIDKIKNGLSLNIVLPKSQSGDDLKEIYNLFFKNILRNFDFMSNYYLFIDDAQNLEEDFLVTLLSECRKYETKVVLINQYLEQFSDKSLEYIFEFCEVGIYFKLPKLNTQTILTKFPSGNYTENNFMEQEQGAYIVLEKNN